MVKVKKSAKPVKYKLLPILLLGFIAFGTVTILWQYLTVSKSKKIELQGSDGTEINRFLQEHLLALKAKGTSSPPVPAFTSIMPSEITRETTEIGRTSAGGRGGGTPYAATYCYTYVGQMKLANGSSELMLASVHDIENSGRMVSHIALGLEAEEIQNDYSCKEY